MRLNPSAVLRAGDFDISIAGEFPTHGGDGSPVVVEGEVEAVVEAVNEQAGFEGAARRIVCWVRAMRSSANSSWELTGW